MCAYSHTSHHPPQSLTIHCSRQHEDATEPCLQSFPDSLLKLRGLQELALCSTGAGSSALYWRVLTMQRAGRR